MVMRRNKTRTVPRQKAQDERPHMPFVDAHRIKRQPGFGSTAHPKQYVLRTVLHYDLCDPLFARNSLLSLMRDFPSSFWPRPSAPIPQNEST